MENLRLTFQEVNPINDLQELYDPDFALVLTVGEKNFIWYPNAKTRIELGHAFARVKGYFRERPGAGFDFIRINADNSLDIHSYQEWSYTSCEVFGKREDGYFDYITEEGINVLDADLRDFINHRNPDDGLSKIYHWNTAHQGYEVIYHGKDAGSLLNAVLAPIEGDKVKLYRLWPNGTLEKVDEGKLTEDAEYIGIDDRIWYLNGVDNLFVNWEDNPETKEAQMPERPKV